MDILSFQSVDRRTLKSASKDKLVEARGASYNKAKG